MITVRPAAFTDRAAIADFLEAAYPGRAQYKFPERWQWQFLDNPFRDPKQLPIWIALDGDRVVGQTAAMVEPLKLGDAKTQVGWSVDTFVLPEYRGQGLGKELQRLNQDSHPVFMSLSMSGANRRIKDALGATALEPVRVLSFRWRATSHEIADRVGQRHESLGAASRYSGLAHIASAVVRRRQAMAWSRVTAASRKLLSSLQFAALDRFPEEIDELWESVSPCFGIAVERTARFLNWKFCDQPHVRYQRFAIRRDRRLCGYVALRRCRPPEPDYGLVVDLLVPPDDPDLVRAALIFAVEQLAAQGACAIRAAASIAAQVDAYRSLGFREARQLIPMCHIGRDPILNPEGSLFSALCPPLSAFFTYGDHDLDQYPVTKR